MNHRFRSNPMSVGFAYGTPKPTEKPDGYVHVCPDGHKHSTKEEVQQCIEARRVHVCSSGHLHTERSERETCDDIRREMEAGKERELQRQHEREMADRQIKFTENLRAMGYDYKMHGRHPNMPQIGWKEYQDN